MNTRERINAFFAGEKPDKIPYTIYGNAWKELESHREWDGLFKAGLGVTRHVATIESTNSQVKYNSKSYVENGKNISRISMDTPLGEIYTLSENGWTQKYWIETAKDYKIMTHIIKSAELTPSYDNFTIIDKELENFGVPLVFFGRTPMQTMLVDYVGLENFGYHLFDFEDEILELYDALLENFEKKIYLTASGPGKYISVLENFTAETLGPKRFEQFHVPVYNKYFPVLQQAGKIVGTHFDGKLDSCSKLIADSPIDVIESLTPPPEGDMILKDCRKIWKEKLFWNNINVSNYFLPRNELKEVIWNLVREGSIDGRLLAFEISEQTPDNWKESIPVVLEALNEIRI